MTIRLHFPADSLILMCAAPGCGKSTFANRHFRSTEVVSSDRCREMVCDEVENMSVHKEAFSLVRHIARLRMSLGRLTVIDATFLTRKSRSDFRRLAAPYRFNTGVILLDLPLKTCLEQNKRRKRKVDPDVIQSFYQQFQKAKQTIREEGFDRVYILEQKDLPHVQVTINRNNNAFPRV
ncbi:serine/threonine protein phosphatase 1 [Desmospora sp. 8437]|nr:serine/threonine protein phosphatase 1 [Desmospora sp. 8437]